MSFGNNPSNFGKEGSAKKETNKFSGGGPIQGLGLGFHAAPAQLPKQDDGRFRGAGVATAHRSAGPFGMGPVGLGAPMAMGRGPAPAFPDMRKQARTNSNSAGDMPAPVGLFALKGAKVTLEVKNDDVDMVDCAGMEMPRMPMPVFLAPQLDLDSDDESMPDMEPLGPDDSLSALSPPPSLGASNSCVQVDASPQAVSDALLQVLCGLYDDIELTATDRGVEGLVCVKHNPVRFEIVLSAAEKGTAIEVNRTAGSCHSFQLIYGNVASKMSQEFGGDCLEEHQFVNEWCALECYNPDNECSWNKEELDLLTALIEENDHDSIDLMAALCRDLESYGEQIMRLVFSHKAFVKALNDRVLTHLDAAFVRMGLVILRAMALHAPRSTTKCLQESDILGNVIALLKRDSTLAQKHAIRCLAAFAKCGRVAWTLNNWQKEIIDSLAILKNKFVRPESAFVNNEMFAAIMEKL